MDVRLPDGTVVKGVPDDMSKADFTAAARRNGYNIPDDTQPVEPLAQPRPQLSPDARQFAMSDNPGVLQQFLGGAKHAWDRAAAGLEGLVPDGRVLSKSLGQPDLQELTRQGSQFVKETGPASSVGQFAGDVALTAPVAAALPMSLAPQIAGNAAWSAAISPEDRGKAAALGGVGGGIGHGLSRAVAALTPTAEAQMLKAKGVPLTYGQTLGPPVQKLENTLAKVPYIGAPIRQRQQEALAGWQQATRNEAAQGAKTLDEINDHFTKAYDDLVRGQAFNVKPQISTSDMVGTAMQDVAGALPKMGNRVEMEVGELLSNASTPADFQQAESILKKMAFRYKSSQDPEQQIYGEVIAKTAKELRDAWRGALPPGVQQELGLVDKAYANFVPIRKASSKGVSTLTDAEDYTPRMLLQATRQGDKTAGKTGFRDTPQGQLGVAGENTLGSASNAPSTPTGIGALLSGGLGSLLGLDPATLALITAAGGAYGTKTGQQALIGSLPAQRALAEALRRATPATVRNLNDE